MGPRHCRKESPCLSPSPWCAPTRASRGWSRRARRASTCSAPTARRRDAVDGELRDLPRELSRRRRGRAGRHRRLPTGSHVLRHSAAHVTAQAVQRALSRAPSSASARPSPTASTTTSDARRPFTPEDLAAIEKEMEQIVRSGRRSSGGSSPTTRRARELADEPFKLELIGLKGDAAGRRGRRRRGGRRRADHLRQRAPRRRRSPGRTCAAARTCRTPATCNGVSA